MNYLILAVLAALVIGDVIWERFKELHNKRLRSERDRLDHAQLMREIRRHDDD